MLTGFFHYRISICFCVRISVGGTSFSSLAKRNFPETKFVNLEWMGRNFINVVGFFLNMREGQIKSYVNKTFLNKEILEFYTHCLPKNFLSSAFFCVC